MYAYGYGCTNFHSRQGEACLLLANLQFAHMAVLFCSHIMYRTEMFIALQTCQRGASMCIGSH